MCFDADVRVLTVRQPWAWAICHAGKDIENRSYSTPVRERIGIHAGARIDHAAVAELRAAGFDVPPADELPTGVVVATARLADCTRDAAGRWARPGAWHWSLHEVRVLAQPLAHRGNIYFTSIDINDT